MRNTITIAMMGSIIVGIIMPVGLTYSVLSRRLLDVGFALNRAVVYSAVSVVVVGLFIVTGLDKRLETLIVEASPAWLTELTTRF